MNTSNMDFTPLLVQERRRYFVQSNGGIALPAAGLLYWLALGVAGYWLQPSQWVLLSFITSGLIFPLGLALQKPLKADLLVKSSLSGLIGYALTAMMLSWPVTIAASGMDKSLAPLTLAIGMSLHWPVIGWLFGSRVCLLHAISRAILVTALWYLFPAGRFTLIPLCVGLLYGLTIWGLKGEVFRIRRECIASEDDHTDLAYRTIPT